MTPVRRSSPLAAHRAPRSWGRSLQLTRLARITFVGVALFALLLGVTEVHGAAADHWSNRGIGVDSRVTAANHPFDAHHFEAAALQDHPPCLACLLQAQTVAVGLAAPGVLPDLGRQEGPVGSPLPALRPAPTRSGSPRAPPRSPAC